MPTPVFGFLALTSGQVEGAIVRDMRLANELHRRGFKVVVYWLMEKNPELVHPGIEQRTFSVGARYLFARPSDFVQRLTRPFRLLPAKRRLAFLQRRPAVAQRIITNFISAMSDGPEGDASLARQLARVFRRDGVTHLLPTFAMVGPLALGAQRLGGATFDYLVSFMGDDSFGDFARRVGREADYHRRIGEVVAGSPWPAVALSGEYLDRIAEEMGLDRDRLVVIPPGIDMPPASGLRPPFEVLAADLPDLTSDLPIVTFLGRQDTEKGIDLLLYAAKILERRGLKFQLVVCGGTTFGDRYAEVLTSMIEHLRLAVHRRGRVSDATRDALYAHSRCVVYPPIHFEAFGMVGAEAMSHGTPVVVPDRGGIAESVSWGGVEGGLTFKAWDSGDLARQLERILTDDDLHARLAGNARGVAENFSVENTTDAVLAHIGLGPGSR